MHKNNDSLDGRNKNGAYWLVFTTYANKRLNIANHAPINESFFDRLVSVGSIKVEYFPQFLSFDESFEFNRVFRSLNTVLKDKVIMCKVPIRQHLRFGRRHSFHHEVWIMGLFKSIDNKSYLLPLRRESDFEFDVFKRIAELSDEVVHTSVKTATLSEQTPKTYFGTKTFS